jgi:hypothetical protein
MEGALLLLMLQFGMLSFSVYEKRANDAEALERKLK